MDLTKTAIFIDGANLFKAAKSINCKINYKKLIGLPVSLDDYSDGQYEIFKSVINRDEEFVCHQSFYNCDPPKSEGDEDQYSSQRKFYHWLRRHGFKVITKPIDKKEDKKTSFNSEITADIYRCAPHVDQIVLISGDGDFSYALKTLKYTYPGVKTKVVMFRDSLSGKLADSADEVVMLESEDIKQVDMARV